MLTPHTLQHAATRALLLGVACGLLTACWPDYETEDPPPTWASTPPPEQEPLQPSDYCPELINPLDLPPERTHSLRHSINPRAIRAELDDNGRPRLIVPITLTPGAQDHLNVHARVLIHRAYSDDHTVASDSALLSIDPEATRVEASLDLLHHAQPEHILEITTDGGLSIRMSLHALLAQHEATLWLPPQLYRGQQARARIQLTRDGAPLPHAPVDISTYGANGEHHQPLTTDEDGFASLPLDPTALGTLHVSASNPLTGEAYGTLHVFDERQVLITTDKPLYQPGQTLHIRLLALAQPRRTPIVQRGLLTIHDGKDNLIHKERLTTDAFGAAHTTFALAHELNLGELRVAFALDDDTRFEKTVRVERYRLPRFQASLTLDRPYYLPGDTLHGVVDAQYLFGKPVQAALVRLTTLRPSGGDWVEDQVLQGHTDDAGLLGFELTLPAHLRPPTGGTLQVPVLVRVEDPTGQHVEVQSSLLLASGHATLDLTPESGDPVPGIENRFFFRASYPTGQGIPETRCAIRNPDGKRLARLTTDEDGFATLFHTPTAHTLDLHFDCATPSGQQLKQIFSFQSDPDPASLLLRPDRAVYDFGDAIHLTLETSREIERAAVDVVYENAVIETFEVSTFGGFGSAQLELEPHLEAALDGALSGELRLEAYSLHADHPARDARPVFVRARRRLEVQMDADKDLYAPGESARLAFTVTDEEGQPARALLGVQIVDEAVFVLSDARPGQLEAFFHVDRLADLPGHLSRLIAQLGDTPRDDRRTQTHIEAAIAAFGDAPLTQQHLRSRDGLDATPSLSLIQGDINHIVQAVSALVCLNERDFGDASEDLARMHFRDPWGQPYEVALHGPQLIILSLGPDEQRLTADDLRTEYTIH